ncbi:MAG: TlpA disulfide reductase family protein [Granulosicoccaceae bacterium]
MTSHARCFVIPLVALIVSTLCISIGWSAEKYIPAPDGIVKARPAPDWDIAEWINADPGTVKANRDRVIVIDFFQLWCPGCNAFSGPLMQKWQDRFSDEIASGDLLLLKIHTVFEGHNYQTTRKLKRYLIEKGISLPVGVDRHLGNDDLPETKKHYQTRGTPEIVMIDREGMIRFQQFGGFDPAKAETYLESLLGSTGSPKRYKPVEVCLSSELCG